MTRTRIETPTRTAIAATLAAALALTPITVTPAQAGDDDKVGAIAAASFFALITAGLIASSVQQAHEDDAPPPYSQPPSPPPGPRWDTHHGRWDHPRQDLRKILPLECAFTVRKGRDAGTYYGNACLKREYSYWPYLPERCEQRIVKPGRDRRGYGAECLSRYGYSAG